jgi:hypothetical protein
MCPAYFISLCFSFFLSVFNFDLSLTHRLNNMGLEVFFLK